MSKVLKNSMDKSGGKKVETRIPAFQLKFENDGDDRISQLPDDIIIQILSLLTVREIVCTSSLSHRWRYMWTCARNLNFDTTKTHEIGVIPTERDYIEMRKYVDIVNRVLKSHPAPSFDLLRIRFDPLRHQFDDDMINNWLKFSIKKKVKNLEIDLSGVLMFHQSLPPLEHYGFESLEVLRLVSLDVTDEWLETILFSCPKLQHVFLSDSRGLVNIKVTGSSPRLNYFEISNCHLLKKIEIYAENLRTLKYSGQTIELALTNTPRLNELYVKNDFCEFFMDNISRFSRYLSQIEIFGFDMRTNWEITGFRHLHELRNLKQLDVGLQARAYESLVGLVSLLNLFPVLQKLILQLKCKPKWRMPVIEVKEPKAFCHKHLKVVKLYGFTWLSFDRKIATYFRENGVAVVGCLKDYFF